MQSVGGHALVRILHSLKTAVHHFLVKGVQEHLLVASASSVDTHGAAGDVRGGNDVVKEGQVDSLEGAGSGALL